jgi:hypothetical protein
LFHLANFTQYLWLFVVGAPMKILAFDVYHQVQIGHSSAGRKSETIFPMKSGGGGNFGHV